MSELENLRSERERLLEGLRKHPPTKASDAQGVWEIEQRIRDLGIQIRDLEHPSTMPSSRGGGS